MRFRFCGELDAPDWLLKEIEILSKISSVRIKFIVKEVITHILTGTIDFEKVITHTSKSGISDSDVKALIAAVDFIITNGAKYNVDDQVLVTELQQLGLPKENCDSLVRPFAESKQALQEKLHSRSLRLDTIKSLDWRVDYLLSSHNLNNVNAPAVQLALTVSSPEARTHEDSKDKHTKHSFEIDADKFRVLLTELQIARAMMEAIPTGDEEGRE